MWHWRIHRCRCCNEGVIIGALERAAALLDEEERSRLRDLVRVFVEEKHWEGCGGLEMTDEVRVTIAAQAALTGGTPISCRPIRASAPTQAAVA